MTLSVGYWKAPPAADGNRYSEFPQGNAPDTTAPNSPYQPVIGLNSSNQPTITFLASADPTPNWTGVKGYPIFSPATATSPAATLPSRTPNLQFVLTDADTGSPAVPGSGTQTGAQQNLVSGGIDIFGTADSFHGRGGQVTGDFTSGFRLRTGWAPSQQFAKAGLTMRTAIGPVGTDGPGSPNVTVFFCQPASGGYGMTTRPIQDAATTDAPGFTLAAFTLPGRGLVTRVGNVFTLYVCFDGVTYTQVSQQTLALPATIYLQLFDTTHDASGQSTVSASFDEFFVSQDGPYTYVDGSHPQTGSAQPLTFRVEAEDVNNNISTNGPTLNVTVPSNVTPTGFGIKVGQVGGKGVWMDLQGNVLQLQGTSISGLETNQRPNAYPAFWNMTTAQWKQVMAAWNINIFRLYIDEWSWRTNPTPAGNNPQGLNYRQGFMQTIQRMIAAGAYVVCPLMWACPNAASPAGVAAKARGQPGFPNTDNCLALWTSFAATVVAQITSPNAVILEIFNEPFYGDGSSTASYNTGNSPTGIALINPGGSMNPLWMLDNYTLGPNEQFNITYTTMGSQAALNAIRAAGFTGAVIYPKPWFCGEMEHDAACRPVDPQSPSNLGSAHHQYGYNQGTANFTVVLNAGIPILITETYGMSAIGGFAFCQANKVGYLYGPGPNAWNTPADLSKMITVAPWAGVSWGSNSANSPAWPPFGPASD